MKKHLRMLIYLLIAFGLIVLITRSLERPEGNVLSELDFVTYDEVSHILKAEKEKRLVGNIVICTGGTADIPVALQLQ